MNPRYKNPRITREVLEHLYVDEGRPQEEIGQRFNVSRRTIAYYLKKWSIPRRSLTESSTLYWESVHPVSLTQDRVRAELEAGATGIEIAERVGWSRRAVYRRIQTDRELTVLQDRNRRAQQSAMMRDRNPIPKGSRRTVTWWDDVERRSRAFLERITQSPRAHHDFRWYSKLARYLAYKHYAFGATVPAGLVIDHLFSVADGFAHGVPVPVISHPSNLRLVTPEENGHKGAWSLMSFDEFQAMVGWEAEPPMPKTTNDVVL